MSGLVESALVLVGAVAVLGALARRLPVPGPILHVAGGFALSMLPAWQDLRLDPQFFFAVLIPPLLFAEGWSFPKLELARVMRPVLLMSVGLVLATTLAVGWVVHRLVPEVPLAAAFALGAIVSPTDAVAVSGLMRRMNLPDRIVHVAGGESLFNDASGLVAFKLAVAAAMTGAFSLREALSELAGISGIGIASGIGVAAAVLALRAWIARCNASEPAIQIMLSTLTPFLANVAAEHLHGSGILSVVAAGVVTGLFGKRLLVPETRLQSHAVWTLIVFAANGLVFVLLGTELHRILAATADAGWVTGAPRDGAAAATARHLSWAMLAGCAAAVAAVAAAVRIAWVLLDGWWDRRARGGSRAHAPMEYGHLAVLGWAGVRGGVTLAAALSLPSGDALAPAFPARDLLIFLAASVILISLVLNAWALPAVARLAGAQSEGERLRRERLARLSVSRAALQHVEQRAAACRCEEEQALLSVIRRFHRRRMQELFQSNPIRQAEARLRLRTERFLLADVTAAQRAALQRLVHTGLIDDEVLRLIERELDLFESSMPQLS